jgi:serine/threonine-protein kinase
MSTVAPADGTTATVVIERTDSLPTASTRSRDRSDDIARGLRLLSLVCAGGFLLVGAAVGPFAAAGWTLSHTVAAAGLVISLAVFGAARSPRLRTEQTLELGLRYQLTLCLAVGWSEILSGAAAPAFTPSWICVVVLVCPALLPAATGRLVRYAAFSTLTLPLLLTLGRISGLVTAGPPAIALATAPAALCAAAGVALGRLVRVLREDLREARRLGNYRLEECLGRGGMGEVWRAKHRLLPRPAAVKFIRPEALVLGTDGDVREAVKRFGREARATASLSSPNTIEVYDFGVTPDGTLCYVMEYLEGRDLDSLVREHGPLSPARVVYLLRQVCISLAEAHQNRFIHRDIKPANIYVCRQGIAHDFVKVLDFGMVAHVSDAERTKHCSSGERTTGGTPEYLPPEIALGQDADARSDLYSLGCVAYWLLTGRTVFGGETIAEKISHHVHTRPAPPSKGAPQPIPRDLELLVLTLLKKNPDDRVQTAADLARRLTQCDVGPAWTPGQAMTWWTERAAEASARVAATAGEATVREVPVAPVGAGL